MSQESTWNDITVTVIGTRIKTLQSISTGVESEDEAVYGEGPEPLYINSGNNKYTGKLGCLKGDLDKMNDAARAAGFKRITDVPPELIVITHVYRSGFNRALRTDTMSGVKFGKYDKAIEQGAKMMKIELPYLFLTLTES
jgi:hypothetical protein